MLNLIILLITITTTLIPLTLIITSISGPCERVSWWCEAEQNQRIPDPFPSHHHHHKDHQYVAMITIIIIIMCESAISGHLSEDTRPTSKARGGKGGDKEENHIDRLFPPFTRSALSFLIVLPTVPVRAVFAFAETKQRVGIGGWVGGT